MTKPLKVHSPCPAESAMLHVGGKWKLAILWQLSFVDHYRYGELRRLVPSVSERVYIRQLRELEQSGLITKTSYPEVPPRVEYSITDVAMELVPLINQLTGWAQRNSYYVSKPVD